MSDEVKPRFAPMGQITVLKSSDALAAVLRERILDGTLEEGAPLPPERDMVDDTGLSRSSVREALRVLQLEGLVRTKAGRNGGAFTRRPDRGGLAHSVGLFVRGRRVPIRALLEARTAIEPSLAYFAALNRSDGDITALEEACRALETAPDRAAFGAANMAWHYAVARASHNDLLIAFLESIATAITQTSTEHGRVFEGNSVNVRDAVARAHRSVTDAVIRRQADAAKRRMERHLDAYATAVAPAGSTEVSIS
jgi:DNA-binding FadR family transcriptional regulator